ncbi:hypothetical protein [Lelliottia sp. CFBP8978]|nr:hypothetical protein [Lelliottia sp. CFBP8978]MDY1036292.1 hypothetical protein [Lelliottia sp. CFBP8978]
MRNPKIQRPASAQFKGGTLSIDKETVRQDAVSEQRSWHDDFLTISP